MRLTKLATLSSGKAPRATGTAAGASRTLTICAIGWMPAIGSVEESKAKATAPTRRPSI
jgi:hypothetical protein